MTNEEYCSSKEFRNKVKESIIKNGEELQKEIKFENQYIDKKTLSTNLDKVIINESKNLKNRNIIASNLD